MKAQGPPQLHQWGHHHPEAEKPDEGDHEPDVEAGKDSRVVGVAGDQDVPEIGRGNGSLNFSCITGAAIAQWICLCLPSCPPGFQSLAPHLRFHHL